MPPLTPGLIIAVILCLVPFVSFAYSPSETRHRSRQLPLLSKLLLPGLLCFPYLLVNFDLGHIRVFWTVLYFVLPVAIACLLHHATRIDPGQNGAWPDFLVLITIGLAVDLRWLEPAWPPHLAIFSKMLLLDAGLWGFLVIRNLHHTGIDLRVHHGDVRGGGINFLIYAPIAIVLGLVLGFLHIHTVAPQPLIAAGTFVFTFFFIAAPEEIFFRGWLQNLLERRFSPNLALAITSVLFGLSHFNKRATHFNWQYVLLATIAGVFYGRAWRGTRGRHHHSVTASALTHSLVDTVWSLFLR